MNDEPTSKTISLPEIFLATIHELKSENDSFATQFKYGSSNYDASLKTLIKDSIKKWHFPVSLPFKLVKLWLNENYTIAPLRLGGKTYHKVITTYEKYGFSGVRKFLAKPFLTQFMIANAYTALCRHLRIKKNMPGMLAAAKLAYNIEPKYFRLKWYALRLNEAGYEIEAASLLNILEGKCSFSDTEEKVNNEVQIKAFAKSVYDVFLAYLPQLILLFNNDKGCQYSGALSDNKKILKHAAHIIKTNKGHNEFAAWKLAALAANNDIMKPIRYRFIRLAAILHNSPFLLGAWFYLALNSNHYRDAFKAFDRLKKCHKFPAGCWQRFIKLIEKSQLAQLEIFNEISGPVIPRQIPLKKKRICYILHNSLPFSSGGYATRSHGVACGLQKSGFEVIVVTRPGYPGDIIPNFKETEHSGDLLDGIAYQRIFHPASKGMSPLEYIKQAADALQQKFIELRPELVMAASNYLTGFPTLIACRRLGIPFIYEVRGLWEITRISREPAFGDTATFFIQKIFEARVCHLADHALTLTSGLKKELISRGVREKSLSIAPNACDPEAFFPVERNYKLAHKYGIPDEVPVIGYIGTFVAYEGLEFLIDACASLKKKGYAFRILLVGNENASGKGRGTLTEELARKAAFGGLEDWLTMPGRIPHADVAAHYSLIDIAPFPRKAWPVCEIVSPMKPLEAMAMGKAVVASSVDALAEMLIDGQTGLIFEKENVKDLEEKLEMCLKNPDLRRKMGANARDFIIQNRSWAKVTSEVSQIIKNIIQNMA